MKKDPFASVAKFMQQQVIDSWKDTLDGFRDAGLFVPQYKEAYYGASNEIELEKVITMFEVKYGRKLKYRQFEGKSLFYVSYVETELSDVYDQTVLNKHLENHSTWKRIQSIENIIK